jgi:tripartite-type tricarboxylate transporter receptor subunit TctC
MKFRRRQFLHLAAGAAVLPTASLIARAQAYPSQTVRMIVPYAGGSSIDVMLRLLANHLSENWHQPVVIENRPGGGTNIGTRIAAQSAPDGYTILGGSVSLATNRYLYPSLGYDPIADFAPVTVIGSITNVMVVSNSSPAKSVKEFINLAHANRGMLTYASGGVGTTPHLSAELLKRMARIEIVHVPYVGINSSPFGDLIGGRLDTWFSNLPAMLPHIRAGALRALAVTSAARSPFAPDIPTFAESGVPGFDVTAWYALFVPARTPAEIVARIHNDTVAVLEHPETKQKFEPLGVEIVTSTPAELATYLKSETEKWGQIIRDARITAQ